ncbi:MAG TPA: ester cyclase [Gemmatimonadales bacterium]|nr:ester cyclase [Gemmatimonadales bacterium]
MASQATITANKEFVREFIDRVFNEHNAKATGDYFSPDVRWHGGTLGTIEGSDAMTDFYEALFTALPDLHATTLDVVADEDTVWCRFIVEGTNESSLFGFPATGKTVRWDEIDTYRVANGKITEEWSSPDVTSILYKIGAYTPPWIS